MKENPYEDRSLKPYSLRPTVLPDGFVLVQDTREQRPLFARIPKGLTIASATLQDGDYSIKGFQDVFAIERKSHDLYGYCTGERDKTQVKMIRFRKMEFVGLAIEMKESDVYQFQQFSKAHPEQIRGALISFQVRYRVHVHFGSRDSCARWILDCAVKFWNIKHEP